MRFIISNKTASIEEPRNTNNMNCNTSISYQRSISKEKNKKDRCCFDKKITMEREIVNNANGDIVCITNYRWRDEKRRVRTRKVVDTFCTYKD